MRFITKLAVLGLAAVGTHRLYVVLRPRGEEWLQRSGGELKGAVDTVREVANEVTQDVKIAALQVQDDVAGGADDLRSTAADLKDTAQPAL